MKTETWTRIVRPADMEGVELVVGVSASRGSMSHMHEGYSIGLAEEGEWDTSYRGTAYRVGRGALQLAQPGEISTCEMGPDRQGFIVLTCCARIIEDFVEEIWGQGMGSVWFPDHVLADRRSERCFRSAHSVLRNGESLLTRSTVLRDVWTYFLRTFARPASVGALPIVRSGIRRAKDFIDECPAADPSLADLAALAGMSPFHFNRAFRQEIGLAPHAYQLHRRIERAKESIAGGRDSSDLALELGFYDQSHFIRHFKRRTGMTPKAYAAASSR